MLKKGTGGWKKVVAAFGEDILQGDGEVDRPRLGQIVFSDPAKRQLLNRYSHCFNYLSFLIKFGFLLLNHIKSHSEQIEFPYEFFLLIPIIRGHATPTNTCTTIVAWVSSC